MPNLYSLKINFLLILFTVSIVLGLYRTTFKPKEHVEKQSIFNNIRSQKKGIYILEVFGTIQYTKGSSSPLNSKKGVQSWIKEIDKCANDDTIKGLLLRINSPGGTIGSSQEMYEALKRFKATGKKLVVSVMDMCASGGYYISLPADVIMANPGSLVGSIGVIISAPELSELFQKWGINFTTIKSGKVKDILSLNRKITTAERELLQSIVDEMYQQFLNSVIEWRGKYASKKELTAVADGRILSATQAKHKGLIDEIGDFQAAKKTLAKLCGLDENNIIIKNRYDDNFLEALPSLFKSFMSAVIEGTPLAILKENNNLLEYRLP